MVYVERSRIAVPTIFSSTRLNAERHRAHEFFTKKSPRAQERFDFKRDFWERSRPDLHTLFHRKCAYCESRVEIETLQIDHFRPTNNAKDLRGATDRDHYWWLAYEWGNLYAACADCQKAKATMFPIAKGCARAKHDGDIRSESALLLDPCNDSPEEHLYFMESGSVTAAARVKENNLGYKRAETTIEIFALNRKDLVVARAKAIRETIVGCERITSRGSRLVAGTGAAMSQPDATRERRSRVCF